MASFAAALAVFILLHVGVSATALRATIVRAIGEQPYRGVFSLASAAALAWLIFSFAAARSGGGNIQIWSPPRDAPYLAQAFVVLGFLLGVTGLLTPSPTTVGLEGRMAREDAVRGVTRITRHPFLWGVALWALGHLVANGDLAGMMLFAGMAGVAVFGAYSIDRKRAVRDAEAWAKFQAKTSNIPFLAIAQGRNHIAPAEIGLRPIVALALFGLLFWAHQRLFGVSPGGGLG